MPQTPLDDVVSHWHKLVENFQTSPLSFYAAVEQALSRRHIPKLKTTQIVWNEGGVLSPRREYLRIFGEHHCFDLCAAPFGNGFFFSSWVTPQKARLVPLYYLMFAVATLALWQLFRGALSAFWSNSQGLLAALVGPLAELAGNVAFAPLSGLVVLWGVALLARAGIFGPERAMLTVPIIGWFYEKMFAPPSYYRLDTMYMFQSAVQSAMLEVINGMLTAKGLRALGESEAKPINLQLLGKQPSETDTLATALTAAN